MSLQTKLISYITGVLETSTIDRLFSILTDVEKENFLSDCYENEPSEFFVRSIPRSALISTFKKCFIDPGCHDNYAPPHYPPPSQACQPPPSLTQQLSPPTSAPYERPPSPRPVTPQPSEDSTSSSYLPACNPPERVMTSIGSINPAKIERKFQKQKASIVKEVLTTDVPYPKACKVSGCNLCLSWVLTSLLTPCSGKYSCSNCTPSNWFPHITNKGLELLKKDHRSGVKVHAFSWNRDLLADEKPPILALQRDVAVSRVIEGLAPPVSRRIDIMSALIYDECEKPRKEEELDSVSEDTSNTDPSAVECSKSYKRGRAVVSESSWRKMRPKPAKREKL